MDKEEKKEGEGVEWRRTVRAFNNPSAFSETSSENIKMKTELYH